MLEIPRPALLLGLAGVLPFAFPAFALSTGYSSPFHLPWETVQSLYALTILAFMSGCLWGFAARDEDSLGYALSTLPALAGFFALVLIVPVSVETAQTANVVFCCLFPALLLLDFRAANKGQAPVWWMRLRVLLTVLVVSSLGLGVVL